MTPARYSVSADTNSSLKQYRDGKGAVLISLSEPGKNHRGLADHEIAARLGLPVEKATEIRCMVERERASLHDYLQADVTKELRFKKCPNNKAGSLDLLVRL